MATLAGSTYLPKVKQIGFWGRVRRYRFAYFMIAPTLIMMLLIYALPILQGIHLSLLDANGAAKMRLFLSAPYHELENYGEFFGGRTSAGAQVLLNAAKNTFIYTNVVNVANIGIGLTAALLLNRRFKGQRLVRTLVLLPWIVPTYAVGMMWANMWLRETGIINNILVDGLHLFPADNRPFWLIGPNAFWAVVVPTVWRSMPFNTVMMLAGLQVIPADLYEAANVDGASTFQKFLFITVPLLKPVLAIMLLWGVIGTAFGYNIVAMMFGNGAGFPGESADLLMPALQRQSFQQYNFGLGAAMSVIMMGVMMIFVLAWMRTFRETLTQQGGAR